MKNLKVEKDHSKFINGCYLVGMLFKFLGLAGDQSKIKRNRLQLIRDRNERKVGKKVEGHFSSLSLHHK